jgi:hypothetical protein
MTFIAQNEGISDALSGYVPYVLSQNSGVTIAAGVDLHQHPEMLKYVDVSAYTSYQIAQLTQLTGSAAQAFLNNLKPPFVLTQASAAAIDAATEQNIFGTLATVFDRARVVGVPQFKNLPIEAQTVLADLAWNHGAGFGTTYPMTWTAFTKGDWRSAIDALKLAASYASTATQRNRFLADAAALSKLTS